MKKVLLDIHDRLLVFFGPQNWWPADSPFEVILGAILTQNTNWSNVELAIGQLRNAAALDLHSISSMELEKLEELIRPSGFFRQKAGRVQNFTRFLLSEYNGDLEKFFSLPDTELRKTLLALPGIGPETADSIMLYAAEKASFVIDAYTQRIIGRIGINQGAGDYEKTRTLFMDNLPHEVKLFNEYHALIVRLAKEFCRKQQPLCHDCPVVDLCRHGRGATGN